MPILELITRVPVWRARSMRARPFSWRATCSARSWCTSRMTGFGEAGRIVETEAYVGPDDAASHARSGRRGRASLMWGQAGVAYVYLDLRHAPLLQRRHRSRGLPGRGAGARRRAARAYRWAAGQRTGAGLSRSRHRSRAAMALTWSPRRCGSKTQPKSPTTVCESARASALTTPVIGQPIHGASGSRILHTFRAEFRALRSTLQCYDEPRLRLPDGNGAR